MPPDSTMTEALPRELAEQRCARLGLPLLPRKQKLQRERGVPPPPR
jgi:hypothetical protein